MDFRKLTLNDNEWGNFMFGREAPFRLPPDALQASWCGSAGQALASQTVAFYRLVKLAYERHTGYSIENAKLLDFGCGWGRIVRLFVKDLAPEQIHGCDVDREILNWCQEIPGNFAFSEPRPKNLPFSVKFDLIYAYSVFTHLGEQTHIDCLKAIHTTLQTGGILIVTIRPREFISSRGNELKNLSNQDIKKMLIKFDDGQYVYVPYNMEPIEGEIPYGDAAIPRQYILNNWLSLFEVIEFPPFQADPMQIPVILRKK